MPGDSPSAGPPCRTMLTMKASGSPFISRPLVRSEGLLAKPAAEGPSPRPPSPWQTAQWVTKSWRPLVTSRDAGTAPARDQSAEARATRTIRPAARPPAHTRRLNAWELLEVTLLFDQLLSSLQIAVPDGTVHVDHALLKPLEEVVVERALVDRITDLHPEAIPDERQDVAEGVHEAIDELADAVPYRQGLHERQHEVGTRPASPHAQRLAEVLTALLDAPEILRQIEEAANARGAVDQEAAELTAGAAPLALEQAVHEPRHEVDVVEAVADHHLKRLRHDHHVGACGGLEHPAVEAAIEREHLLVERLPGVVLLLERVRGFLGALGQRRAREGIGIDGRRQPELGGLDLAQER